MEPAAYDLSSADAARYLGVNRQTIAKWAREGKVRSLRTPGGHRRYRLADLEALTETEPAA